MESFFTTEYAPFIWLIIGVAMLTMEAFGASGIGFLFAGLGAFVTAILIHFGLADNWGLQLACFFGSSILWAIILWQPMKRLRSQKHSGEESFQNIVGDEVLLIEDMVPGKNGKVRWSGTNMSARLEAGSPSLTKDSIAIIRKVEGTLLIVSAS